MGRRVIQQDFAKKFAFELRETDFHGAGVVGRRSKEEQYRNETESLARTENPAGFEGDDRRGR